MAFDLARFRDLAFGRRARPDHPIADEAEARKMIDELPADEPAKALAELTHWARSINEEQTFTPELRARVLMEIDAAAHPFWRELWTEFLAPKGTPSEGQDGDTGVLHALREFSEECANGYALCLTPDGLHSGWIGNNLAMMALRWMHWHSRRMQFSRTLRLQGSDQRWDELHRIYRFAEERGVFRIVNRVFPDSVHPSSVKQEYVRQLLCDIARPDRFTGREFELMYRIVGRVAASVKLEHEPLQGALHVVVPQESHRPRRLSKIRGHLPESALYIDSSNAIPRLQSLLEEQAEGDPALPDPLFGEVFTLRERRAMIGKLTDQWAESMPQRRTQRVKLHSPILLHQGFADLAKALPALDQGTEVQRSSEEGLRILMNAAERKATPQTRPRVIKGELDDASTDGMGLLIDRSEARWAQVGALVAACLPPANDWAVGTVRRANDEADRLHLGVAVLSRKPRLMWMHLDTTGQSTVWEEAQRFERNFLEYFQRGILIEVDGPSLKTGQLLLPGGMARRGTQFDVPVQKYMLKLVITGIGEENRDFQRVVFERKL